jgi:hypothetical protein
LSQTTATVAKRRLATVKPRAGFGLSRDRKAHRATLSPAHADQRYALHSAAQFVAARGHAVAKAARITRLLPVVLRGRDDTPIMQKLSVALRGSNRIASMTRDVVGSTAPARGDPGIAASCRVTMPRAHAVTSKWV